MGSAVGAGFLPRIAGAGSAVLRLEPLAVRLNDLGSVEDIAAASSTLEHSLQSWKQVFCCFPVNRICCCLIEYRRSVEEGGSGIHPEVAAIVGLGSNFNKEHDARLIGTVLDLLEPNAEIPGADLVSRAIPVEGETLLFLIFPILVDVRHKVFVVITFVFVAGFLQSRCEGTKR